MIISAALSLVLVVLASSTALLGLLAGLVGTTIALQIETFVALESAGGEIEEKLQSIRSRDDRKVIRKALERISESAATTLAGRNDVLIREMFEAVDDAGAQLRQIADGYFTRNAGEVSVLLGQTGRARTSIKATTEPRDVSWWGSYRGDQFLEASIAAIRDRGVIVERIFFVDGTGSLDEVIERHKTAGIRCYVLSISEVGVEPVNVTIFDDRFCHRDQPNPDGSTRNHLYSVNPREVLACSRQFDRLRATSVLLT